jgi:hypothetical protein
VRSSRGASRVRRKQFYSSGPARWRTRMRRQRVHELRSHEHASRGRNHPHRRPSRHRQLLHRRPHCPISVTCVASSTTAAYSRSRAVDLVCRCRSSISCASYSLHLRRVPYHLHPVPPLLRLFLSSSSPIAPPPRRRCCRDVPPPGRRRREERADRGSERGRRSFGPSGCRSNANCAQRGVASESARPPTSILLPACLPACARGSGFTSSPRRWRRRSTQANAMQLALQIVQR